MTFRGTCLPYHVHHWRAPSEMSGQHDGFTATKAKRYQGIKWGEKDNMAFGVRLSVNSADPNERHKEV